MTPGVCSPAEAFNAWAEVYDSQPNPLLLLEQRVLGAMLPDVQGLDVLDVGCGTGRWLQRLTDSGARSLVGVDPSPEMLAVAAGKVAARCTLQVGDCRALPVSAASADLLLCSFVLSHVDDLEVCAREMYRTARPGATIFVADMHPETEVTCGWKRTFRVETTRTQMKTRRWGLQEVLQAFTACGLKTISLSEPRFGLEERSMFEECDRLGAYHAAESLPAIYVLRLKKPATAPRPRRIVSPAEGTTLSGARCAVGPDSALPAAVSIVGSCIDSIQAETRSAFLPNNIDLSGYLVLPGLINAHDHLEFALYPNIGRGPYRNATEWAHDIHSRWAALIQQHREVPQSTRLWWGAIRNLLSGVTTVCHHNPVHAELTDPEFPIGVLSEFSWAHSLAFEPEVARRYAEGELPFVMHAGEGVDDVSTQEIGELDRLQALSARTILIHALGCSAAEVALINRRGASVVVCPTSNAFLFKRTPSADFLRLLNRVMLGSDSPLTAAGDLLDEINFVHAQTGLDVTSLYSMVTTRPAEIFRLRRGEGALTAGATADLFVVRDTGLSPAATLAALTSQDIEMVMVKGRVQLAGASLMKRLPPSFRLGLEEFAVNGQPRWVRAPVGKLLAEAEACLGPGLRLGGKRVSCASAA